jgi:hypothetical protein
LVGDQGLWREVATLMRLLKRQLEGIFCRVPNANVSVDVA